MTATHKSLKNTSCGVHRWRAIQKITKIIPMQFHTTTQYRTEYVQHHGPTSTKTHIQLQFMSLNSCVTYRALPLAYICSLTVHLGHRSSTVSQGACVAQTPFGTTTLRRYQMVTHHYGRLTNASQQGGLWNFRTYVPTNLLNRKQHPTTGPLLTTTHALLARLTAASSVAKETDPHMTTEHLHT